MGDVVCIVAAACDLAIVDTGFMTAVSASGETLLDCLFGMYHKACSKLSKDIPGRDGLLSLMLCQLTQVTAAFDWVRPALCSNGGCRTGCVLALSHHY